MKLLFLIHRQTDARRLEIARSALTGLVLNFFTHFFTFVCHGAQRQAAERVGPLIQECASVVRNSWDRIKLVSLLQQFCLARMARHAKYLYLDGPLNTVDLKRHR